MTSIEVTRSVLAEPSSVALVLAGPAARELWPGSGDRRVMSVDGPAPTTVTVDPPRRAGVGFVARVVVRAGAVTIAAGRLTIRPARGDVGGADLTLVLTTRDGQGIDLRRAAERYVDNVVRVSLERSSAA